MRTDKQIFRIFQAAPQWVFELTGLPSPGKSTFQTVSLKALERSADGVNIPVDARQPITVLEIQFQKDEGIYTRIVAEMALIQEAHAWREVQGIILFRDRSLDPLTPPWHKFIHSFSLNELLARFEEVHPQHALAAVFKPVFLDDLSKLAEGAPEYYRMISKSTLDEACKTMLSDVFVNWLLQRFKEKGRKEIEAMLIGELPNLEETRAGKELIRIGEERGKLQGKAEGKAEGQAEGKAEGKAEGVREALIILLEANLGPVPADLRLHLETLGVQKAQQLLPLLSGWSDFESLRRWLAQYKD